MVSWYKCKRCVWGGGGDGYTLQPSLILSSTLYSNIKFILDRKYFQIIKKMKIFFFSIRESTFGYPPPPVHSCLLLADRPPTLRADILYGWPRMCSWKYSQILFYFQRLFLIKLQRKKRDFNTGVFVSILRNF